MPRGMPCREGYDRRSHGSASSKTNAGLVGGAAPGDRAAHRRAPLAAAACVLLLLLICLLLELALCRILISEDPAHFIHHRLALAPFRHHELKKSAFAVGLVWSGPSDAPQSFSALPCNAMRCDAMRCNAMQCDAMQCYAKLS